MKGPLPFPEVAGLIEAVYKAGQAILEVEHHLMDVQYKTDTSPVTEADLKSHDILCTYLVGRTPYPVISEEDHEKNILEAHSDCYWLVDPLDGTKEFLAQNGEFTVNVALMQGGYPIWGVVLAPESDELYVGGAAEGTWLSLRSRPFKRIRSCVPQIPYRVILSRSHARKTDVSDRLLHVPHQLIPCGSSLKFCRIAEGRADIYPRLGPTAPWDIAAGQAVLEGAGGVVLNWVGERFIYNQTHLENPPFIALGQPDFWPVIQPYL